MQPPEPTNHPQIDRTIPSVPNQFARLILQMTAERGHSRSFTLEGLGISDKLIDDDGGALSVDQHERLLSRLVELSGNGGGEGYELGLRVNLAAYAMLGYAMLSQLTLGDAIRIAVEFSQIVVPVYRCTIEIEDDFAVLNISMDAPIADGLYQFAYDMALTCVWRGLLSLMGEAWPDVELWFSYPEPTYFAAYESRLAICRFNMGANQICFPAEQLSTRINTGDPLMARVMTDKLERIREARRQQSSSDIRTLVLRRLTSVSWSYPDQEEVCSQLFMSTRTLKRKLQQAGTSFQVLLDDVRLKDAKTMLAIYELNIEDIASRMGYDEPSNFTHAFRRWTGITPSEWRQQHKTNR